MPLTGEVSAGLGRRFLVAPKSLHNVGSDVGINFFGGVYDPFNNQGIIGGDVSYLGFMADLTSGKVTESAALPSTAIPSGSWRIVKIDYNNQQIYVMDPGSLSEEIAASSDGGASWFDIGTNLPAGFYNDISSWRTIAGNDTIIAARGGGAGGVQTSDDNGATWTGFDAQQPGPGPDTNYLATDAEHKWLVTLGTNGITTTDQDDVTVAGNWNVLDANSDFGVTSGFNSFAFNSDGTKFIANSVNGHLLTTVDFINWVEIPQDDNPFWNANGPGAQINGIVHVNDLNGWLLFSDDDKGTFAFVPSNESPVNTIFAGNYLGDPVSASLNNFPLCAISDGTNALWGFSVNQSVTTLRE